MNGRCVYGDCRESMRAMIADGERVQMCVTSPPYYGLRDYGTATWEGGDAGCDHVERNARGDAGRPATVVPRGAGGAMVPSGSSLPVDSPMQYRAICGRCGARRIDAQIGLEPTVAEYVANMVDVFRLVRELLADDGTLFLNLGDSYASSGVSGYQEHASIGMNGGPKTLATKFGRAPTPAGLKPKDLIGIPWRVAFALQADGWYLRSDIIWAKPNPMPESVTDRPTKAHEYLFLLSKRPSYYYDAAAIAERASNDSGFAKQRKRGINTWDYGRDGYDESRIGGMSGKETYDNTETRNRRTVWTVATQPYGGAHFATFPPALIEPCILAGSREGEVVFDPFLGSGTTGEVATRLGRRWLGCELNEAYRPLIEARTAQMGLVFA